MTKQLTTLEDITLADDLRCVSPLKSGLQELVAEGIFITAAPMPFNRATKCYMLKPDQTVTEVLAQIVPECPYPVRIHVYLGPDYIPTGMYDRVKLKKGTALTVNVVPQQGGGGGKKNPLATILSLAVIVAAAWAAPIIAGSLLGATSGLGFTILSSVVQAGIATLGGLLVSAIAPPAKPRNDTAANRQDAAESPTLFIEGARNRANPYGVIPVVLGRHRMVPPLGALNYSETSGDLQYVRQLFCGGYGELEIPDRKIGETNVTEFDDVQTEDVLDGTTDTTGNTLYPGVVLEENLSVQLTYTADWISRTSQSDADELIVDITFPKGLVEYDSQGKKGSRTVVVQIEYKLASSGTWSTTRNESFAYARSSAIRRSVRFEGLTPGTYDIRLRRADTDSSSDQVFDESWWTSLRTVRIQNPINFPGISTTAIRAKATDQLNGPVEEYNGTPVSVVPDWDVDTQTWIKRATNNPASLFRYVAQNTASFTSGDFVTEDFSEQDFFTESNYKGPNAVPLPNSRLDIEALQDWHEYCEDNDITYNAIIDFSGSVFERLNEIAAAGNATLTLVDNKWSVIIERPQTVVSQHFTSANTWGYRCDRTFVKVPHAFRVSFINEEKGFLQDEMVVYDDGYDSTNATDIQGIEFPGITNPDQIYRKARRYIAILKLRPAVHSFYVDAEHLVSPRGSLVKFSNDVVSVGLLSGYIKKIITDGASTPLVTGVQLDQFYTLETATSYSLCFRGSA